MELEKKFHFYYKCCVICFSKHREHVLLCMMKETAGPRRAPLRDPPHPHTLSPTEANSEWSTPLQAPPEDASSREHDRLNIVKSEENTRQFGSTGLQ